jgi:hypothetical protein
MIRILRVVSAAGFLLFATLLGALVASPESLERRAKEEVVQRLRAEVLQKYPALGRLGDFEGAAENLRTRAARARRFLQSQGPDLVAAWLSQLCRHDCPDETEMASLVRDIVRERLRTLEIGLDRLHQWAQGRYDQLVGEILYDLRIFAGTNTLMFLLAFIGAYFAKAPPPVLTIVSAALVAAAVAGTVLYLFAQNWLQTLIFSDYVGTTYIVWVGLILGVGLDLLLNRARLVDAFVNAVGGAVSAIGH